VEEFDKETTEMYFASKKMLDESKENMKIAGKRIYSLIFIAAVFFIFLAFAWSELSFDENISAMYMNIGTEIFGVLITLILAHLIFYRFSSVTNKINSITYTMEKLKPYFEKDDNTESQKSDD